MSFCPVSVSTPQKLVSTPQKLCPVSGNILRKCFGPYYFTYKHYILISAVNRIAVTICSELVLARSTTINNSDPVLEHKIGHGTPVTSHVDLGFHQL